MKKRVLFILAIMTLASIPTWTYNPPPSLTPKEQLGKFIFFDKISSPDNMACADCHAPSVGFTGPIPGVNRHGAVYKGAVPQRNGNRKPPSAAYATLSPVFHYDASEGLFIGGNFWDGRATGAHLGNPAADQALGPFLNPVEQNNPDKQAVLMQIASSNYAYLWQLVWGSPLSWGTQAEIDLNYGRVGLAIAEYEASSEVNAFTSKWDYKSLGLVTFTAQESWGESLFNGKAMCAECHMAPLFTDFTFDNLGVPKNPENPFYDMDQVYLNGTPINPLGDAWIDLGLGGFLQNHPNTAWAAMAAENMGKHKVPTLRNVDLRPGNGFVKAYMHNGVFKSLKEVVHFYNTRDVETWPAPEYPLNVNVDELGDLGLTEAEEEAIVAFMKTLSDGYSLPSSNRLAAPLELNLRIPNPTVATSNIEFTLPISSNVSIELFNLTGSKVATIVNGPFIEGVHSARLNPEGLPSGLYIIRMYASDQLIAKKVLIN